MKGVVLVPARLHPNRIASLRDLCGGTCVGFQCWYELLEAKLGFKVQYTNTVMNVPPDTDVVWCSFRNMAFKDIGRLNHRIKLITHLGDVHGCHGKWLDSIPKVMDRSDLILASTDAVFKRARSQYLHKYVFWPHYFRPHNVYVNLPLNDSPKMKCLLPGRVRSKLYGLRTAIAERVFSNAQNGEWRQMINTLKHYWFDRKRLNLREGEISPACGSRYARLLNQYFCCLVLVGDQRYMIAKCVEVPAAGSLLLTQETHDLTIAGFVPMKHYVPVTDNEDDIFRKVKMCLKNPDAYQHIRKAGMEFVRKTHGISTRFQQFKRIL